MSVTMKVPEPFSVPPDQAMSVIVTLDDVPSVPPVTTARGIEATASNVLMPPVTRTSPVRL